MTIWRWPSCCKPSRTVLLHLFALFLGLGASASGITSRLTGVVTDSSGASLPNANVTLSTKASGATQHTTTASDGAYSFFRVEAGEYVLSVDAEGFTPIRQTDIHVDGKDKLTIDIRLEVSTARQSVTVRGVIDQALNQEPALGKTKTKLQDLPMSVQIIPREILSQQGTTMLRQGISNASGVNVGGQDTKGFYDHFLIRGLNAQMYSDGFSDGDQLGGLSHSLNGVRDVEVLEGPGSALFGSGAPGGTVNIVHLQPAPDFGFADSLQGGSFGTVANGLNLTGPIGAPGLNYRLDSFLSRSDGFRDLASRDYEVRPALSWRVGHHNVNVAVDARHIEETPDSYGLIYLNGSPITVVSEDAKYSTPFAFAHTNFVRPTITDSWQLSDYLSVSNRLSFLYRTLDVLGNGDSTSTKLSGGEVVGRQLRQQNDTTNSFDYQLEPVWKFKTGWMRHTVLTGFEVQHMTLSTSRSTADLPNITDAFTPLPPETSVNELSFLCDAKHSCDNDYLSSTYFGAYATDQMDVTKRLKIRAGFRQDWFDTSLTPQITVPGRFGTDGQPLLAGIADSRHDSPISWNAGVLYRVFTGVMPYFGVSTSHLANFNSENTQNGVGQPEAARQYEAGIKFSFLRDKVVLTPSVFNVTRNNVATLVTINGVETIVFDSQRSRGFEASLYAALTQKWQLTANVTDQSAVITDNPQGVTSVGNRPQGAPAHLANLWTTYAFAMGTSTVSASAED
jgi:iron complex outermembrane recepter protein